MTDKEKADASKAAWDAGDFQLAAALLAELRTDLGAEAVHQNGDGTVVKIDGYDPTTGAPINPTPFT